MVLTSDTDSAEKKTNEQHPKRWSDTHSIHNLMFLIPLARIHLHGVLLLIHAPPSAPPFPSASSLLA